MFIKSTILTYDPVRSDTTKKTIALVKFIAMQYRRISKRKILPAYRILDHFRHIFRESGLTLADIAKSRIDQVRR